MLREKIHADDPLAEYMMNQRSRERAAAGIVGPLFFFVVFVFKKK